MLDRDAARIPGQEAGGFLYPLFPIYSPDMRDSASIGFLLIDKEMG